MYDYLGISSIRISRAGGAIKYASSVLSIIVCLCVCCWLTTTVQDIPDTNPSYTYMHNQLKTRQQTRLLYSIFIKAAASDVITSFGFFTNMEKKYYNFAHSCDSGFFFNSPINIQNLTFSLSCDLVLEAFVSARFSFSSVF